MSKDKRYCEQLKELQDVALFHANLTTQLGDEVKQLKADVAKLQKKIKEFLNIGSAE